MLYTLVKSINLSLRKIHTAGDTREHITSRATNGLLHNYFPLDRFAITPEQTQAISNKKPDYSVEMVKNDDFVPYLYAEVKSLVNSDFGPIMDQLHDSILFTVDNMGNSFSVYVIAMKGTHIAFFQFYSFADMLDEYGIQNYRGFVPLNQLIDMPNFVDINHYSDSNSIPNMLRYIRKYSDFPTHRDKLLEIGVRSTDKISHPHIWDLLNHEHVDHVHNLFMHMHNHLPGKDIEE